MGLDGVEIFVNSSGSHTEIRKGWQSTEFLKAATAKSGGCYLFANQRGCDGKSRPYPNVFQYQHLFSTGDRVYFPGDARIALNGDIIAMATPYSLSEVEVVTATIDLESIRVYRNMIRSRSHHAAKSDSYPRAEVNLFFSFKAYFFNISKLSG